MTDPTFRDVVASVREWWPHRHGLFATEAMLLTVNAYVKSKKVRKAH